MPRLFGTDGIRGIANVDLRPTTAYALGRAVAHRLAGPGGAIVVGQDTRRSGDMFVAAIVAGATSLGVDVHIVGVVPTPALAYIAGSGPFAAGIMVSASHNPAQDNGLKVLDAHGLKLDDAVEDELEQLIWQTEQLAGVRNDDLGRMVDASTRLADYLVHRLGLAESIDAGGLRLVLDAANGSASVVGPQILAATGAHVDVIHAEPDGSNINVRSGATSPASLAARVTETGADAGFALDGDADRLHRGRRGRAGRRRRPGPGHPGPRPPGPRRAARRRARRVGAVQRRAPGGRGGGRRADRPDAGRRQVHPRGDAGRRRGPGRREERPRHRARAHDVRATGSSPRWRCSG